MLEDLIAERKKKLAALQAAGVLCYPESVPRTHAIAAALQKFSALAKSKKKIALAGRITGMRGHGGVIFFDLKDASGALQVVAKKDTLRDFALFQNNLDIGDFISVFGALFTTARGEKSIDARHIVLAAKSLRPVPSERFGIEDAETRLRKRYLDLLVNPALRELFRKKSVFWNTFRTGLTAAGFLEVETPVLESVPGGADAEPFTTHMNALDIALYLRIALELPQKKLLVGGYEKVFELGRIFRNEGIDHEHLQDYTQLEFYWAYADYGELMLFVEKLYKTVVKAVLGKLSHSWGGKKIDWGKRWPKIEYYGIFQKLVGLSLETASQGELFAEATRRGLQPASGLGRGRLIDLLFKKVVRPTLIQPSFLVNPPADIEPLAKRLAAHADRVARFQVVACGTELGKGFSENNDPLDQRARFEEQMRLREKGDKEAQRLDEDFLEALEYGMPPAAGFGVSERLFAILIEKPVRECVFFPLLRPRGEKS
ncbi:MAG: lysine--tRNA ligase [Candidatus Harrisonbacteria bacterium]|nr:lysine--tRNA ligase [Candidatus Harrisonbacteria bacterium]